MPRNFVEQTTRQTYSVLDWLGDIGGLHDILVLIVELFLQSYQGFYQARLILTSLFHLMPDLTQKEEERKRDKPYSKQQSAVQETLSSDTKSIQWMCFPSYCFCCRSRSRRDYSRKLDMATTQIERELDLGRFIRK